MQYTFDKRTFNIRHEYTDLMKKLVPVRKQTEFVNNAIKESLEKEIEKLQRKEAIANLAELRKIRLTMPETSRKSEDVLRELRQETIDRKTNLSTKNT